MCFYQKMWPKEQSTLPKDTKKCWRKLKVLRKKLKWYLNYFMFPWLNFSFINLRDDAYLLGFMLQEKYKKVVFKGKLKEATETLENLKSTTSQIDATSQQFLKENQTMNIQENAEFIQKKIECCKAQLIGLQGLIPEETTDHTNKVFRQKKEDHLFRPIRLHNWHYMLYLESNYLFACPFAFLRPSFRQYFSEPSVE